MKKNIIFISFYGFCFIIGILFIIISSFIFYYNPAKINSDPTIFFNYNSKLIKFGDAKKTTNLVTSVNFNEESIVLVDCYSPIILPGAFISEDELLGFSITSDEVRSTIKGRVLQVLENSLLIMDYNNIYIKSTNVNMNLLEFINVGDNYLSAEGLNFNLVKLEYINGLYKATFKYLSSQDDSKIYFSEYSFIDIILETTIQSNVYYFEYDSSNNLDFINKYQNIYFINNNKELIKISDFHISIFSDSICLIDSSYSIEGLLICIPI